MTVVLAARALVPLDGSQRSTPPARPDSRAPHVNADADADVIVDVNVNVDAPPDSRPSGSERLRSRSPSPLPAQAAFTALFSQSFSLTSQSRLPTSGSLAWRLGLTTFLSFQYLPVSPSTAGDMAR